MQFAAMSIRLITYIKTLMGTCASEIDRTERENDDWLQVFSRIVLSRTPPELQDERMIASILRR